MDPRRVVLPMTDDPQAVDAPWLVRARVRHEPDRSCAVLVGGPDGEVQVGNTRQTGRIGQVAREGADRLWGRPAGSTTWANLELSMPRPPCGRDGQWVRVVAVGEDALPDDLLEVGQVGLAYWFGAEWAWMVSGPGLGGSPRVSTWTSRRRVSRAGRERRGAARELAGPGFRPGRGQAPRGRGRPAWCASPRRRVRRPEGRTRVSLRSSAVEETALRGTTARPERRCGWPRYRRRLVRDESQVVG